MLDLETKTLLYRFATALAIGLLVGLLWLCCRLLGWSPAAH